MKRGGEGLNSSKNNQDMLTMNSLDWNFDRPGKSEEFSAKVNISHLPQQSLQQSCSQRIISMAKGNELVAIECYGSGNNLIGGAEAVGPHNFAFGMN